MSHAVKNIFLRFSVFPISAYYAFTSQRFKNRRYQQIFVLMAVCMKIYHQLHKLICYIRLNHSKKYTIWWIGAVITYFLSHTSPYSTIVVLIASEFWHAQNVLIPSTGICEQGIDVIWNPNEMKESRSIGNNCKTTNEDIPGAKRVIQ